MLPRTNSQFVAASVTEFISVWAIGGDASLTLTTNGGFTTIAFNCTIGHPGAHHSIPPTPSSAPSFPPPPPRRPRHRGPKEIERNKQRAARHQAAKTAASQDLSKSSSTSATASEASTVTSSPAITAPVIPPTVITLPSSDADIEKQSCPTESVDDTLANKKCDQCGFISKSSNDLRVHTRKEHRISQLDGRIDNPKLEKIIEHDLKFKCDLCNYSSTEENNLWRHTEKIHFQCGICDVRMTSEASLKLHKKEKHCNQCGKVVKSFWHKKHFVKKNIYGDIYDVCGPECYIEFHNKVVDPPPSPGYSYG